VFKQNVIFVIGAGASREYNFPLGSELKEAIASAVKFRFEYGSSELISGSPGLLDHIRRHVKGDAARANEYTKAASILVGAIPSFISVDEALHFVSESPHAVEVGKIAIVDQILKAERESTLAFNPKTGRPGELPGGWIAEMFSMALAGIQRKDLRSIFDQVTFINFNYDRAVEQYLYWALQERASATAEEAGEIVAKLNVLRPYGSIGQFAPDMGSAFSFGTTAYFDPFSRLKDLGTYTDQTPMHDSAAMTAAISGAKLIIFLGFGYHRSNMDIIVGKHSGVTLGSVLGIHTTNHSLIANRVAKNLGVSAGSVELISMKAAELLQEFRPRILMMVE
jgi:hypothetical protein